jgi:ketosteroid isomerase-like protein
VEIYRRCNLVGVTVDVARRYGEALDDRDWETARQLLDPDVEIVRPSGRCYQGAERWIQLLSDSDGFDNIASEIATRAYEQRNGEVVEVKDLVHRWRDDGALAYRSREETLIRFREGRISRMESTVEHHPLETA